MIIEKHFNYIFMQMNFFSKMNSIFLFSNFPQKMKKWKKLFADVFVILFYR